jgi:hypothetical protein
MVLQLTPQAVAFLEELRRARGLPDTYAMRVFGEITPENRVIDLRINFREGPEDGDAVVEQAGRQVFVADGVAEPLAEAVIDTLDGGGPKPFLVLTSATS